LIKRRPEGYKAMTIFQKEKGVSGKTLEGEKGWRKGYKKGRAVIQGV